MNNFCTLFDSNFLPYGLALYESLRKNCKKFHLYIFAFDERCYDKLLELKLHNVTIISLAEFEDEELLAVKPTRSIGEYCWTCTPSVILYCLNKYNLDICTYLDSDIYFYSNPEILLEEVGGNDVIITEHRYTPEYDKSSTAGTYCVQFMSFKNTQNGLDILNWWRDACIKWCYARFEDGKFGDQKYLDDWTTRFKGVHVLKHLGGGVAPWNIQQYKVLQNYQIFHDSSKQTTNVIFYHFHDVKVRDNKLVYSNLFDYNKSLNVYTRIYIPYIKSLLNKINKHRLHVHKSKWSYFVALKYFSVGRIKRVKHGIYNRLKDICR